ncbi:uncharacterized protein LOC123680543 isoform X2 [Harmonia axyridis]|nr:uncharacterized protein LOC123680543 isoform X2 [Harmonia axyridis]XP_045474442.1 uncharacterized protein LOC123680543 isoform X2 [Harmonia axyridis]XP_045474444.1 uncharacterized protein LOC123680543 isoform X2 [Harmonia axyridis]
MAVNHDPATPTISPFSKMKKFYTKYFPAEPETFGARFSILALIISMFALQILFFFIIWFNDGMIFMHTFYVIIASVHYGLYYGLSTGKLRLITPWLVWKMTEIIFTIALIFKGTLSHSRYSIPNTILAFLIVVTDVLMMFVLFKNQVQASDVRNFEGDSDSKKTTPEA